MADGVVAWLVGKKALNRKMK
ncbi:uncharacterized protein G2W53_019536 [Senna tora]|uniref:Uncharacterized protein n=1 Tax=Senna tora TaxID=362788 RepID=A0A834TVZ1_9FABA|nr:uncharacterized protein G2W53_019536 [Senna tora]